MIREKRRTAIVVVTVVVPDPDWPPVETLRFCEVPCRDQYLSDLSVPGGRGASMYRSHGTARVHIDWGPGKHCDVKWSRGGPSAIDCWGCEGEWAYWLPAPIAAAQAASERAKARPLPAGLVPIRPGGRDTSDRPCDRCGAERTGLRDHIAEHNILSPLQVIWVPPNRDGVTHHLVGDGRNRWEIALELGIEEVPVRWLPTTLSNGELMKRLIGINTEGRVWTLKRKHELCTTIKAERKMTVREIAAFTGFSVSAVQRALHVADPDTGPGRPGEHPEVGSERYLELVRQVTDPDATEDMRNWARGDGAVAMMSPQDYGKAPDTPHAADRRAAMERFTEFAEDIGMTRESLVPYWITAVEWPRDTRKPRTSYAAHAAVRGNNRELLRSGMDEHAARMAAMNAVDKKLSEVLLLMLNNQDVPWANFKSVKDGMAVISAYLEGGWDGFAAWVDATRPEPRCDACGWPESMGHHRLCSAPKPCQECEGTDGGHLADLPGAGAHAGPGAGAGPVGQHASPA